MKRIFILATLIWALALPVAWGQMCPGNLVTNGGFESWNDNGSGGPPDDWTLSGSSVTAAQESTTVFDGTYSTAITWTSTSTQNVQQSVSVTEGNTYDIRIRIYDNDSGGRARLYCNWRDAGGSIVGSALDAGYTSDSTSWQTMEILGETAPSGAATLDFQIRVYDVSGWPGTATIYADDAEVCLVTSTPTPTPTPTACGNNIVNNPSFESWSAGASGPPDGWSLGTSGFTATQESATVFNGTYSVNLTWTSTSTQQFIQNVPVIAGENYDILFWVYDNDPAGRVRFYGYWRDSGGSSLGTLSSDYSTDHDGWQVLSLGTQTAPAGAVSLEFNLRLYDDSGWGGSATIYVDVAEVCGNAPTPTATPTSSGPTATPTPTPNVSYGDVVINEIMYDSVSSTDEEWVELYNTTTETIDISGWCLTDAPDWPNTTEGYLQVPAGTTIAAGDYIVLSDQDISEITCDVVCTEVDSFALGNSGDNLALFTGPSASAVMVDGSLTVKYPDLSPSNTGTSIEKDVETDPWPSSGGWHTSTHNSGGTEHVYHTACGANSAPATVTPTPTATDTPSGPTNTPTATPTAGATDTPTPTPTMCSNNIVVNPGFESWTAGAGGPPDGWVEGTTGFTATQESTYVYDGTYSVNLTWTSTSTQQFYQDVPVNEGEDYEILFWVYDNDPNGRVRFYGYWRDSGGSSVGSALSSDYSVDYDGWQVLSLGTQTVPAGAAYLEFNIRMYDVSGWSGSATVYVDVAEVCGNAAAPTPTPTGPTATPTATPTLVAIHDIQYTTDPSGDSPYDGQIVRTQGIVTSVEAGNPYIFIQDGTGAWSGLLLYNNSTTVNRGDLVEATGTVTEYYGMTELSPCTITVLSSGWLVPAPETLTTGTVGDEQWESVLVKVENVTVTNEDMGYGEWEVDDSSGPVVVDDLYTYSYTPSLNEVLNYVIGPLNYSYSAFKIEPRDDNDIEQSGSPTPTPTTGPTLTPTPTPNLTSIHDIQYTTDPGGDSPYVGQTVRTQGVVTACESGNSYIFIQDGTGAWSGLLLYNNTATVARGDLVEAEGTVTEHYGMTELSPCTITVLSSGQPVPSPEVLTTVNVADEQWESVLVRVENVTVTNEDMGYGEWEVDDSSGPVIVDDLYTYTYTPVLNAVLDYVIGPLNYSYSNFKIEPRDDNDIQEYSGPTPTPQPLPTTSPVGFGILAFILSSLLGLSTLRRKK